MSYEYFIAKRYFHSKRRTGFISLINYFSIAGVMIGVAALIIVLSVMNGFETEVRSRIIGFDAHILFRSYHDQSIENYQQYDDELANFEHVTAVSPYIKKKCIIFHGENADAFFIKGINKFTEVKVTDIENTIIYGELNLDTVYVEAGKPLPGLVIGKSLAMRLDLNLNDQVWLGAITNIKNLFMTSQPYVKAFRVAGYFETGLYEYDNIFGYISLENAQKLYRMPDQISGFEVTLDQMNLEVLSEVQEKMNKKFGYPYYAETWYERNSTLFSWMWIEKIAAFLVLCLIILVAAFNIISTLIMVVMEKKKEIGILKSIGSTSESIMKIFVYQGIISGTIGTILGCVIGYMLCWSQLKYQWFSLPSDIYFISSLPVEMKVFDFIMIAFAGIIICLLATLYPSWKAANLDPVQAIRYE